MATSEKPSTGTSAAGKSAEAEVAPSSTPAAVDAGNYELIRGRLETLGRELSAKTEALNARRQALFGSTALTIIGNERARTEHNCLPRDIVAVGDKLLFGYNVFLGLKSQTTVSDVFSLHHFRETPEGIDLSQVSKEEQGFLNEPSFVRDFEELYRYYKESRLTHLKQAPGRQLAVFQIGMSHRDVKVLRWSHAPDGSLTYMDNRGERDYTFPPTHDFEWIQTTRENQVPGRFPHVSILDEVFVETLGGTLTLKVENSTETGEGIYSEPVQDRHQSLDDAEIAYAKVGVLILLRVKPYREEQRRYLVFNTRAQTVTRIDAIGQSCIQLPNDHGIIFPGGYYLNTGEMKQFSTDIGDMLFESVERSPNGEDVLYVFYQPKDGRSVLLPYNLIRKEVQSPIVCHGYCIFRDGRMVVFRAESDEPARVHPLQIWQTPFQSDEYAANAPRAQGWLGKIGNADLVRGISDCNTLKRMIDNQKPTMQTYEDLIATVTRILDAFVWLGHEEVGNLQETLKGISATADKIVDEFDKVIAIRKRAEEALSAVQKAQATLRGQSRPDSWNSVAPFIEALDLWRRQQGQLFSLREMRYMQLDAVDKLEKEAKEQFANVTLATVKFLSNEKSLEPYKAEIDALYTQADALTRSLDLQPLKKKVDEIAHRFELLTEIISGLKVEDPTLRTQILERISEVYALLNRSKAHVERTYKDALGREGIAQFGVEFKLFSQAVTNALAMSDTPERCDEQLSRLTVQLEELEARFGEFDQFLADLAGKREEVLEVFEARKRSLLEDRNRRAQNLMKAAERILSGVVRRVEAFSDLDQLNTFFVADPMVAKVRDLADQLRTLGDGMRADELLSRLKAARQEASRSQRDRAELFEEGPGIIKLGRHRFTVSTQPVELTLMPRDEKLTLHVTGTDFFDPLEDKELYEYRGMWDQQLVSENAEVYRSEYLAVSIFLDAASVKERLSFDALDLARTTPDGLLTLVREYASTRYDEGYERGVHDVDATLILNRLLDMRKTAGLLRFSPEARSWALLFWACSPDEGLKGRLQLRARSLGRLAGLFQHSPAMASFAEELGTLIQGFLESQGLTVSPGLLRLSGEYLAEELRANPVRFVMSGDAFRLKEALMLVLDGNNQRDAFLQEIQGLEGRLVDRFQLAEAWVDAFLASPGGSALAGLAAVRLETIAFLLIKGKVNRDVSSAVVGVELEGLIGQHPRISSRKLWLRFDEVLTRVLRYKRESVPAFQRYKAVRGEVLEREKVRLRLKEFQPRVLTSFVRNRLINEVYLPLVGDNLAKQMGALGDNKRTDLMGMLLLISPPGYGKTTLMEYVANRLGLIFMKINGPSLGHEVTSIDPQEAPNATSRQEVEKLNLALEMGNNVMLYVDDIQHTNPEFLQKFISLCDATRKIEGVWRGRTRTYDMRGKRFCVVMAGNPYTETGEKFRIPDMLANRADTYNLGDILNGREDLFALSYLENSLTSNSVLSPLAARDPKDIQLILRMAQGQEVDRSELSHEYSQSELEEILSVFAKLFVIQKVLLKVNLQYILSAGQAEEYRTEPPFKLQGSYRNMNKMTEKVLPVMNSVELEQLIDGHYTGEAQTLTTGAEQNLLKLAELRDRMSPVQAERWKEIKKSFSQRQMLGGEDDPVGKVAAPLSALVQELRDVRETLLKGHTTTAPVQQALVDQVQALGLQLSQSRESLSLSVGEQVGKPLQAVVQELLQARRGLQATLQQDIASHLEELSSSMASGLGGISTGLSSGLEGLATGLQGELVLSRKASEDGVERISQGLHQSTDVLWKGLARGLSAALADVAAKLVQGLSQHLELAGTRVHTGLREAGAEVRESLDQRLSVALTALTEQQLQSGLALRGVLERAVAGALSNLSRQLERHGGMIQASVAEQLVPALEAVDKELEALQQGLRVSLERAVAAQLASIATQVEKQGQVVQEGLTSQVATPIGLLTTQLERQGTLLQGSVEGQVVPALHQISEKLEVNGLALQKLVEQQVVPALVSIDKELETLQQGLRVSLERALTGQVAGLNQQVTGIREALEKRGTGGEGGGESLALLQKELKELRESLQGTIYRPLVAVAQQCDAVRRGLQEALGKGVTARLDLLVERMTSISVALQRPGGRGVLDEVASMGREMEALRHSVHEAVQVLDPLLATRLK